MSTRSMTYLSHDAPNNYATARAVYRHCDGYLTEAGRDLLALAETQQARGCYGYLSSVGNLLAALYLLRGTSSPDHYESASPHDHAGHGDLEYEYWLQVLGEEGRGSRGSEPAFSVYWRKRNPNWTSWTAWAQLDWPTIERSHEAECRHLAGRGYEVEEFTRDARPLLYA